MFFLRGTVLAGSGKQVGVLPITLPVCLIFHFAFYFIIFFDDVIDVLFYVGTVLAAYGREVNYRKVYLQIHTILTSVSELKSYTKNATHAFPQKLLKVRRRRRRKKK